MDLSIVVPLVVAGALLALLAGVAVALRNAEAAKRRVEALFRRAPKPPKPPDPDHYYRPYWS
jgi:hypothetical protein